MGDSPDRRSLTPAPAIGVLAGAAGVGIVAAPATAVWSGCVALAGGLLLAFGIALAYRRLAQQVEMTPSRGLAVAAGLGAALAALAAAVTAARTDVSTLPGAWDWTVARPWLWTLATLALLSAAVLLGLAARDRAGRQPLARTEAGRQLRAVGAGLLAVVVLSGAISAGRVGIQAAAAAAALHASTATAIPVPPVLADPTRQVWRYTAPSRPARVLSAGAGPLVELSDGVIALDGRTGRPRWQYRRDDGSFAGVQVSPGGRTVVLWYAEGEGQDSAGTVLTLDALTGRVRATHHLGGDRDDDTDADTYANSRTTEDRRDGAAVDLTDSTYLVEQGDEYAVRDLDSRRWLWQARQPAGCVAGDQRTLATTILLLSTCTDPWRPAATSVVLTSYADRTGRLNWRHTIDITGQPVPRATLSEDGKVVAMSVSSDPSTTSGTGTHRGLLIDNATGRILYSGNDRVIWPDSRTPVLSTGTDYVGVLDVVTGHTSPVPAAIPNFCSVGVDDPQMQYQESAVRIPSGVACLDADPAQFDTYRARGAWPVTTFALPTWRRVSQLTADFGSPDPRGDGPFLVRTPGAVTVFRDNGDGGIARTLVGLA